MERRKGDKNRDKNRNRIKIIKVPFFSFLGMADGCNIKGSVPGIPLKGGIRAERGAIKIGLVEESGPLIDMWGIKG